MIDGADALQIYGTGAAIPLSGRVSARGAAASGGAGALDFSALLDRALAADTAPDSAVPRGGRPERPVVDKTAKLYEQCLELETFLLKTLVKGMRNTVQKSGLVDTGFAGEFYEDMLYDEYTKDLARSAGLGLAETAYLELTGQRGILVENRVSPET